MPFLHFLPSAHLQDLHSFPTRRSSDLAPPDHSEIRWVWRCAHGGIGARGLNSGRCRSEEHTSELQSHSDLVCRLLLEIKNTGYTNTLFSYCIIDHAIL